MNPADLVSVRDIAQRSGYPVTLVGKWVQRYSHFPAPVTTLASGRVWLWPEVEAWLKAHRP